MPTHTARHVPFSKFAVYCRLTVNLPFSCIHISYEFAIYTVNIADISQCKSTGTHVNKTAAMYFHCAAIFEAMGILLLDHNLRRTPNPAWTEDPTLSA